MKKPKHVIALTALAALTLTGCTKDLVADKSGNVVTVTIDDKIEKISVDFLFDDYLKTAEGIKAYYDAVYQVVVRELFEVKQTAKRKEIYDKAELRVKEVKDQAKDNAKGGKSYDEELEDLLKSHNVETVNDLKEKFAYELMQTEVKDQFFDGGESSWITNAWDELVAGDGADYDGYLKTRMPYHVRHILIKVGAESNDFTSASISKDDALRLGNTIKALATIDKDEDESFGKLAKRVSEDEGSAAEFGDLGIMSLATGFVNEFKLGVYTYDALFNQSYTAEKQAELNIPADAATYIKDTVKLGEIPYGAALEILKYRETEKSVAGKEVNDNDSAFYPRNVLFNKYFNKHNISVITPNDVVAANEVGTPNAAYSALKGFNAVAELGGKEVLTDEKGNVILVARAGASGSYEGIHFIVVERSALADVVNGTSLEEYYTTFTPGNAKYPVTEDGANKDTFVNFLLGDANSYKQRADKIKTEIKSFDPNINDRIFEKLLSLLDVKFKDAEAKAALDEYMENQQMRTEFREDEELEQLWATWVEYLSQQQADRATRLVPEGYISAFIAGTDYVYGGSY